MAKAEKIQHEKAKRAILDAGIEHADVVLRALARVDTDGTFRAAIEAVMASSTEDTSIAERMRSVVTTQFAPIPSLPYEEQTHYFTAIAKQVKTLNPKDVIALLNEQTVAQVAGLLTNDAIKQHIYSLIDRWMKPLIAAVLGVRISAWNEVEYDTTNDRRSILRPKIEALVLAAITEKLEAAIQKINLEGPWEKGLPAGCNHPSKTVLDAMQTAYETTYERLARERINAWAVERARLDVDKLIGTIDTAFNAAQEGDASALPVAEGQDCQP